jgi:CheY-like chemotaxis protein
MRTILVIDDDEQIHGYLQVLLEKAGYEVRHASNGMEGLQSYRAQPTDLVICDIFMDQKEGLETVRELRQEYPQAKVISMSGGSRKASLDFLLLAKKFGAVATLDKPLDRVLLLQTVQQVLDDSNSE